MDKDNKPGAGQPQPTPNMPSEPMSYAGDAKRMSFGSSDMFDFKNSPPLTSFIGKGLIGGFKLDGDPLTQMSGATRRDSLKGMHNLSDFSTD